MHPTFSSTIRLLGTLGLVVVLATAAVAAEPQTPAEEVPAEPEASPLVEQSKALLADIATRRAKIEEWGLMLEKAQGADQLIFERQLSKLRVESIELLHDLAENLLAQEAEGTETSELRPKVESLMELVPEVIYQRIGEIRQRAADLRSRRESTAPDKLIELERQIWDEQDQVNLLLKTMQRHTVEMEALGMETTEELQFLTDEVSQRAEAASRVIELSQEQELDLNQRLAQAPDDATLKAELGARELESEGALAALNSSIEILQYLELETAEYQELVIRTRGLTTDILESGVAFNLMGYWYETAANWIKASGPAMIFKVVFFLLILLAFRVLASFVRKIVVRSMSSSRVKISILLQEMITSMVGRLITIFGLLVALSQVGVNLGPLLAGLGVIGFIIGFALQDTLSNFASGLMILFYRPFDMGDLVDAGGAFGTVSRMTLVSTTILTLDHQTLVVPNNKIWGDVIKNVTAQRVRRVDLTFGISYSDDISKTEEILKSIVREHDKILDEPEALIKLHKLNDSSVDFIVRPWCKTDDYWDVYWDLTREVKMRFDREGISIPFPQRDIHLYKEPPPD
jgi:small conductance mechanosensitive channel